MITKEHHKAIAEIIRDTRKAMDEDGRCKWWHAVQTIECKLAQYFTDDNPRFDRSEFIAACKRFEE